MIIYLEGVDGSGKTTLHNMLVPELSNVTRVISDCEHLISTHPTRPGRVTEKELFKKLTVMAKSNKVYMLDRGPISDIIYRIFDDYKSVTNLSKLTRFFKKFNNRILIIYCHSDKAEKNMLARGDDNPVALQRHKELSKAYKIVMDGLDEALNCNLIDYDYANRLSINNVLGFAQYFVYMASGNTSRGDNTND